MFLKSNGITALGAQVYASMENSPARKERNSSLRAGEAGLKHLLQVHGSALTAGIEWVGPGSVVAKAATNTVIATYSKRTSRLKFDRCGVEKIGLTMEEMEEAYQESLDV
jgi:hypothetical protein